MYREGEKSFRCAAPPAARVPWRRGPLYDEPPLSLLLLFLPCTPTLQASFGAITLPDIQADVQPLENLFTDNVYFKNYQYE